MKPVANLGNSSFGRPRSLLMPIALLVMDMSLFVRVSGANDGDQGLFARVENLRADNAIRAVGEMPSPERGHGRTLKSSTGRVYFYAVLQDAARNIKISSAEDAIAAVAFLGDHDPKMRYLVLYSILTQTGLGEKQSERVAAEEAIIWGRDAKNRIEWMQRITKALSARVQAKP